MKEGALTIIQYCEENDRSWLCDQKQPRNSTLDPTDSSRTVPHSSDKLIYLFIWLFFGLAEHHLFSTHTVETSDSKQSFKFDTTHNMRNMKLT